MNTNINAQQTNTPPTKFVIYKRLSKQKQQGNQYGFEAQDHDIAIFLKQYPDAVIISMKLHCNKCNMAATKDLYKASNKTQFRNK